jgi:hypothetical protein
VSTKMAVLRVVAPCRVVPVRAAQQRRRRPSWKQEMRAREDCEIVAQMKANGVDSQHWAHRLLSETIRKPNIQGVFKF